MALLVNVVAAVISTTLGPPTSSVDQGNAWSARGEADRTLELEERLRHDLYYIDNWSLWLDCVVPARTLLVPFPQRNAC